jgi:Na+/melibiose symporter-like transporter
MMGYVSYYANGVAGLSVVLVSFILTGMRVFDGVTDPVIGYVIDRTNGRFGKFRPFMILGWIILAASSLLMFFTTHLVGGWLRVIYFIAVYTLYIIGYTFQTAVVKSGQSVITNDVNQRPMITFFDSTFIMLAHGATAFYVSVYLIGKYRDFNSPDLFREFVVTVVILSGICTLLAVIGIWQKDKAEFYQVGEAKERIHFRDYIGILKHNKPIRMLTVAAASNKFAAMVYGNSAVVVMLYGILMNNYPLSGIIGIVVGIPNLAIIYLGITYAKHVGQKKAMIAATWGCIVSQTVLMFMMIFMDLTKVSLRHINLVTVAFLLVFTVLNGLKSITNNMVVPMIADCTDYEYTLSGHFVPGIMGALFSFIDKTFSAFGTGFVGIVLSMFGYSKAFPQVGDALTVQLKFLTVFFYCVIPIIGWVVTIVIMHFYGLDKKTVAAMYTKEKRK